MLLKDPLTWNEIKKLVEDYDLEKLGRSQTQLISYQNFKKMMMKKNVSLTTNLMINTMHWLPPETDIHLSTEEAVDLIKYKDPRPFANPDDTFISVNKFPYYIKERTLHLLVWVKFPMLPDPNSEIGDIDDKMKQTIENYIQLNFVQKLGIKRDHLIWWKNYASIQSIKSIPHVHVLVNLEDDIDGSVQKNLDTIIGTGGLTLDYLDSTNCKL
ncbi:hypothetical protein C6P40_002696 [Pichia californica]|uniref:N-acetylglucosamine-induced protein 1 n=1 Tax=Pichia californica TaxID=460514 RepID=A0A9P6WQ72_9ASCO|nr:hypothetical protein C6P42_001662 [[Candida] californica]KAG0691305.1 hypothetical protein C6P40_002696 [[Candida] californica]